MTQTQTLDPKWEVTLVGVGTLYAGTSHKKARKAQHRALQQSRHGNGPGRGQVVTVWLNGAPDECLGGWADELAAFHKWQRDQWLAKKAALQKPLVTQPGVWVAPKWGDGATTQAQLDRSLIEQEWDEALQRCLAVDAA